MERPGYRAPRRTDQTGPAVSEAHLPLEERSDYGKVIIGLNKQVTADIEFDYYVFIGDRLGKTN